MRILLTSGIYPPDIGGPATFVPQFAQDLHKNGHSVSVLALQPAKEAAKSAVFDLKLIQRRKSKAVRIIETSISIFVSCTNKDRVFSNGLFLESCLALRILRKKAVAKVVGDPVWERARNNSRTTLNVADFQNANLKFKDWALRRAYVFALNSYDQIICPSLELSTIVKEWGVKKNVSFIPNGVELNEISPLHKNFDLVYVGRLVAWKNLPVVIEVAHKLDLKLCIIGDGPDFQSLNHDPQEKKCKCVFKGELDKKEIIEILSRSKIFVLFSQYEGLSYALLEAMSCGVPSIVSNNAGNLSVIEDGVNGKVVSLDQPDQLAKSIEHLLSNPSELTRIGMAGRRTIEETYQSDISLKKIGLILLE